MKSDPFGSPVDDIDWGPKAMDRLLAKTCASQRKGGPLMGRLLRYCSAMGVLLVSAIPVLSAAAAESDYLFANYVEPCPLPSVASSFAGAEQEQIHWASYSETAGDGSSVQLCEGCTSCGDSAPLNCANSSCNEGDYCLGPAWYFLGGAAFLKRSRPEPTAIITPPTGTPGKIVSGSDFGFEFDAGPEFILARRFANGLVVEGRYFSDEEASSTFNIPSINTFRVAGIGVTILGGGSINSTYTTDFESTEVNFKYPLTEGCYLLAGFRSLQLQDRLRSDLATPVTFVEWDEDNDLNGAQMGLDMNMYSPGLRLRLDGVLKAGVFGNSEENRFRSTIVASDRDTSHDTSFIGEIDFTASCQITQHIAARGGYMVLWIDNAALADNAASTTVQVAGGTNSPVNNGDLFYNGAIASLEFGW